MTNDFRLQIFLPAIVIHINKSHIILITKHTSKI